jgi:putative ABC transport system permease protein
MGRSDEDFRAEVESHIALETDRLIAQGLSPADARDRAMRTFGNPTRVRERFYESRRVMWIDDLVQDARYAVRSFGRTPAFTAVALVTLALGIGATAAIYSVVNAVLLRPLPYNESERLVRVLDAPPSSSVSVPRQTAGINMLEISTLREQSKTLSHIGVINATLTMTLTAADSAVRLEGTRLSPQLFQAVRPPLVFGRLFEAAEEVPGAGEVVILSYGTWQRHFGADPHVLGQSVLFDGRGYTVIGVTAEGFRFPESRTAFWIPFQQPAGQLATLQRLVPVARLSDGVDIDAAREEIAAILARSRGDASAGQSAPIEVTRLRDQMVDPVRVPLLVLGAAVALVLLIACANVANLLLARTAAREKEIAMRRALGATSSRLIRQAFTESAVLALAGAAGGIVVAFGGVQLLRTLAPAIARRDVGPGTLLPRIDEVAVDLPALMFAVAAALVAGLIFGLAPALRQMRLRPAGMRVHRTIVVAEIAMATTLFVGGALLMRSFVKLSSIDPGYDTANVLTFQVFQPLFQPRPPNTGVPYATADDLITRLASIPGITAAGYSEQLPTRNGQTTLVVRKTAARPAVGPRPPAFGTTPPPETPDVRYVTPGFLDAMGIDVIEGPGFGDPRGPRAILINRTMAKSGFLGEHPIGTQVYMIGDQPWEIRGIVEDVRQYDVQREPDPQIFFDLRQLRVTAPPAGQPWPGRVDYFAVRTERPPAAALRDIRAVIGDVDRQAIVDNVATMEQILANSISRPRLYATLLAIFAGVAVALAAIGIYGVMAYAVAQRVREIGIRMALGAEQRSIMRLVLSQSTVVTFVGVALGLAGAAALTRYLGTMLYGLTPLDVATYAGVAVAFTIVATLAAAVPARRATRVDPVIALRCE